MLLYCHQRFPVSMSSLVNVNYHEPSGPITINIVHPRSQERAVHLMRKLSRFGGRYFYKCRAAFGNWMPWP